MDQSRDRRNPSARVGDRQDGRVDDEASTAPGERSHSSLLVQLGIHHIPATQALFNIGSLSLFDCALTVVVGAVPLFVIELRKIVRRLARRRSFTQFHRQPSV